MPVVTLSQCRMSGNCDASCANRVFAISALRRRSGSLARQFSCTSTNRGLMTSRSTIGRRADRSARPLPARRTCSVRPARSIASMKNPTRVGSSRRGAARCTDKGICTIARGSGRVLCTAGGLDPGSEPRRMISTAHCSRSKSAFLRLSKLPRSERTRFIATSCASRTVAISFVAVSSMLDWRSASDRSTCAPMKGLKVRMWNRKITAHTTSDQRQALS